MKSKGEHMKKQNEKKLFAFKLAEKNQAVKTESQWKARAGVAVAGCTGPMRDFRYSDSGMFC